MLFFDPQLGVVGAYTRLAGLGLPRPGAIAAPRVMATPGATRYQARLNPRGQACTPGVDVLFRARSNP